MTVDKHKSPTTLLSPRKTARAALMLCALVTVPVKAESIQIHDGWMRAVPPVSSNSAAYMTVMNAGENAVQLIGASSPLAGAIEVHEVVAQDGVMTMMPAGTVEIPAGGQLELKPGGFHLMMMDLKRVPSEGETVALTLHFEKADDLPVQLPVKRSAGMPHGHQHHKGQHQKDQHRESLSDKRMQHQHH